MKKIHSAMIALAPAMVLLMASPIVAAEQSMPTGAPTSLSAAPATKTATLKVNPIETRIADLHKKLQIIAEQEPLWAATANVMRENAQKLEEHSANRNAGLKAMTAVDDLKSYQLISDEHSEGLKRLIPAFESLYAKMSPAQQKNADQVFGEHQRHASHG